MKKTLFIFILLAVIAGNVNGWNDYNDYEDKFENYKYTLSQKRKADALIQKAATIPSPEEARRLLTEISEIGSYYITWDNRKAVV